MKNPQLVRAVKLGSIGICLLGIMLSAMSAQDKAKERHAASGKSVGFTLSDDATEHDLGLPIYPGAHLHQDSNDDSPGLNIGLWGEKSGFRLVVLKLESNDSPTKVAKFYHKPLSHYGKVVDCGKLASGESTGNVNCENDHPVPGGYTFEAGTKEKMHVVAIEPNGNGSLISLVYVQAPKSDNND